MIQRRVYLEQTCETCARARSCFLRATGETSCREWKKGVTLGEIKAKRGNGYVKNTQQPGCAVNTYANSAS